MIRKWQGNARVEAQLEQEGIDATATAAHFQEFVRGTVLEGRSLASFKDAEDADLQTFVASLRSNTQLLFRYIKRYVLPEIFVFPQQISCGAQDLVSMFANVQGFSGTPWNASTFHQRLQVHTRPDTDGTVEEIFSNPLKTRVAVVRSNRVEDILSAAAAQRVNGLKDLRAIVDSGALFKGTSTTEVVDSLAAFYKSHPEAGIQGIRYYDGGGNLVHKPLSEGAVGDDAWLTLFDHPRTTGAHVHQPSTATAAVTVGELTLWRDLQQGALRMRQLKDGQNCVLVVPDTLATKLQDGAGAMRAITPQDIERHALANQSQILAVDKILSLKQLLTNHVKNAVLKSCARLPAREQVHLARSLKSVLITTLSDDLFAQFGTTDLRESEWVVREFAQSLGKRFHAAMEAYEASDAEKSLLISALRELRRPGFINGLLARAGALSELSRFAAMDESPAGQEVQQEVSVETITEAQRHESLLEPCMSSEWQLKLLLDGNIDIFARGDAGLDAQGLLKSALFVPLNALLQRQWFADNLYVSEDFARTITSHDHNFGSRLQKRVYFFLVEQAGDGAPLRMIAVSPDEANIILKNPPDSVPRDANGKDVSRRMALCIAPGAPVWESEPSVPAAAMDDPKHDLVMAQLGFLNEFATGERLLGRKDRNLIEAWLEREEARGVREFFQHKDT